MVGGSDVVMTISFHAPHGIIILKTEIFDQLVQQFWIPRHLLQAWKQAWVLENCIDILAVLTHEGVVFNV